MILIKKPMKIKKNARIVKSYNRFRTRKSVKSNTRQEKLITLKKNSKYKINKNIRLVKFFSKKKMKRIGNEKFKERLVKG